MSEWTTDGIALLVLMTFLSFDECSILALGGEQRLLCHRCGIDTRTRQRRHLRATPQSSFRLSSSRWLMCTQWHFLFSESVSSRLLEIQGESGNLACATVSSLHRLTSWPTRSE